MFVCSFSPQTLDWCSFVVLCTAPSTAGGKIAPPQGECWSRVDLGRQCGGETDDFHYHAIIIRPTAPTTLILHSPPYIGTLSRPTDYCSWLCNASPSLVEQSYIHEPLTTSRTSPNEPTPLHTTQKEAILKRREGEKQSKSESKQGNLSAHAVSPNCALARASC